MAGYTRQASSTIINGSVIDADDFTSEYNAVENAFNANISTGHKHDGSAGEGAPITKVGPSQDLIIETLRLLPKTTNTLDLGTALVQFKNAWFDGTVDTDALIVLDNATVGGTLGVTGVLTATGGVSGNVTGNVTGALTGNVTGDVTGDVTGALTGNVTGNVTGALTGNVTGDVTGALTGNADTATAWVTARDITLTGDVTGTVSGVNGGGNISIATTVAANSVALGTDTTGDYVSSLVAGTGVTLTNNSGETSTPTLAIGQAVSTTSDVTFNDLVVSGDLTVSGTTTTINTETLNLADNQIILNSNEAGTPSQNGGIEIERGTETNKTLVWNETDDKWTVGSETFVAGTFEGDLTGNAATADSAGTANVATIAVTVSAAAQPNITSLGTLTTLTVDDINIDNSKITNGSAGNLTLDTDSYINLDSGDGLVQFIKNDAIRGGIYFDQSSWIDFKYGASAEMRMTSAGIAITNGLYVGSSAGTPTDNDIYAAADITANRDLIAGNDILMTAGASDWKFEVDGSNQLIISYGGVNKMKLDTSGNLTVTGNITGFGTI